MANSLPYWREGLGWCAAASRQPLAEDELWADPWPWTREGLDGKQVEMPGLRIGLDGSDLAEREWHGRWQDVQYEAGRRIAVLRGREVVVRDRSKSLHPRAMLGRLIHCQYQDGEVRVLYSRMPVHPTRRIYRPRGGEK